MYIKLSNRIIQLLKEQINLSKLLVMILLVFFITNSYAQQNGWYKIQLAANGKYLHENGGGDKMVSTRYQPNDNFTRFYLERQNDNSFRIKVKANNRYFHANGGGDKLVSTRYQPNDNFTRFYFEPQSDGTYRVKVKATNRYWHVDESKDKLLSTRWQTRDKFAKFYLIAAGSSPRKNLAAKQKAKRKTASNKSTTSSTSPSSNTTTYEIGGKIMRDYTIEVKTQDKSGAGTDSNIYLTFHFKNGKSSNEFLLNPLISGDAFESGDFHKFKAKVKSYLGVPISITVRSDGKYAGSAWDLGYIKINNKKFSCNCEINKGSRKLR